MQETWWRNAKRSPDISIALAGQARAWTEKTVRALEEVTPELIPYEELDFNMGERWIPTEVYADFAEYAFDVKSMWCTLT